LSIAVMSNLSSQFLVRLVLWVPPAWLGCCPAG